MRTLLYARLLVIAAAFQLYRRIEEVLWTWHGARLSLLKFMNYLAARPIHLLRVIQWMKGDPDDAAATALIRALARYCCYGKRKTRRNFSEI